MNEDRIADIFIIGAIITVFVLKLTGTITISWLLLLSPLLVLFGLGCLISIILAVMFIYSMCTNKKENKEDERY